MRRIALAAGAALLLALTGCESGTGAASSTQFQAVFSGGEEVPAVSTAASGRADFELVRNGAALEYSMSVANISNVTMAHIHRGARGQNGPIIAYLFGPVPGFSTTASQTLKVGTLTTADIIPVAGFNGSLESLIEEMRQGNTYVNVHTTTRPAGEIRGQIELRP
jgi:hypothetical protein